MQDLLQKIKTDVLVCVSNRGVVNLHPCFTVQRKGGNGQKDDSKYSKGDLRHGGNQIQIKSNYFLYQKCVILLLFSILSQFIFE